mgnify:CR=1 FL=1
MSLESDDITKESSKVEDESSIPLPPNLFTLATSDASKDKPSSLSGLSSPSGPSGLQSDSANGIVETATIQPYKVVFRTKIPGVGEQIVTVYFSTGTPLIECYYEAEVSRVRAPLRMSLRDLTRYVEEASKRYFRTVNPVR